MTASGCRLTSGLAAKRLELMKEAAPGLSRVLVLAYLVDPISPLQVQALKDVAPALNVTLHVVDIKTPDDLPGAFDAGIKSGARGVLSTAESIFRGSRALMTELAAQHKLPAIYPYAAFALSLESGGLMAYDITDRDLHRSAASYDDKILKGAKPSDLTGLRASPSERAQSFHRTELRVATDATVNRLHDEAGPMTPSHRWAKRAGSPDSPSIGAYRRVCGLRPR